MKKNLKTRILSLILAISMVIPNSSSLTTFAADETAAEDSATPGWEKIPEEDSSADASTGAEIIDEADLDEDEDIETYERSYMIFEAPNSDNVTSDFPEKMEAKDSEGNIVSVPVTWECDNYDSVAVGTYHFSAVIDEDFLTDYSEETFPDSSDAESKDDNSSGSLDAETEDDDAGSVTIDEDSIQEIIVTIEKNRIAKVKTAYDDRSYSIHKTPVADKIISSLPDTIEVVYDDENKTTGTIDVEDWDYDYDDSAVGTYYFVPAIDDDRYELVEGAELPECSVSVEKVKILEIKSEFKVLKYEIGDVPEDVTAKMPDTIKAVTSDGKEKISVESWECGEFDAEKTGAYKFTPVISADYAFDDDVEIPSYEVNIVDPSETRLEAECDGATIIAETKKGVIPNGTKLSVRKMTDEEIEAYEKAVAESGEISDEKELVFAFDVELVDKKGNKIEPDGEVSITIEAPEYENVTEPEIVHFKDGDEDAMEVLDTDIDDTSITVTTESLSPVMGYGIMAANVDGEITKIDAFSVQFVDGADKTTSIHGNNSDYVWTAENEAAGHRFIFRVNYNTSGNGVVDEGKIRISIPRSILKNKSGNSADTYEMSVPSEEDLKYMTERELASEKWTYKIEGDNIVVYNRLAVDAGQNGYFEVAYATSEKTFNYYDYGAKDGNDYIDEHTPFTATISSGDISKTAGPLNVYINTSVTLSSTAKEYPSQRTKWNSSWGTEPTGTEKYYYQEWTIRSDITDYNSQKYDFSLSDIIQSATGTKEDGSQVDLTPYVEVYAYKMAGKGLVLVGNDNTINSLTADGYRYDLVITRINRKYIDGGEVDGTSFSELTAFNIVNKVTATLHPVDGVDDDTIKTSQRTFKWTRPTFVHPTGSFYMIKYGDENWYGSWNHRWHNERTYSYYSLDEFQEVAAGDDHADNKIEGLEYAVWAYGYPFAWTLDNSDTYTDKDGNTQDYEYNYQKYGHKKVTFEVSDSQFFPLDAEGKDNGTPRLQGTTIPSDTDLKETTKLAADDYDIAYIDYDFYFTNAQRDEDGNPVIDEETQNYIISRVTSSQYTADDIITVYTKSGDDAKYVEAGTYSIKSGLFAPAANSKVTSMTSSRITFADGVDGFKVQYSTTYYYVNFCFYPYVTIFDTENTRNWTGTGVLNGEGSTARDAVLLKNVANCRVYMTDDTIEDKGNITDDQISIMYQENKMSGDRMKASVKSSQIKKKVVGTSNNVRKKTYNVTWKVTAGEIMTSGHGEQEFRTQESGTFYDLLPEGATLNKDTVQVEIAKGTISDPSYWLSYGGSSTVLSENEYDVELIENYEGCGRTLLIVRVKTGGAAYNVSYTTVHAWNSIQDFGKKAKNPVAYETGNEKIAYGFPDDPSKNNASNQTLADSNSTLTGTNIDLFTGLDDTLETDERGNKPYKFIYAENTHNIAAITAASAGLQKRVKSSTDTTWSYDTIVYPEGTYMYQLRYQNDYVSKTTSLILFDSIENFGKTDDGKKEGVSSDWTGTLTAIDVSQLKLVKSYQADGKTTYKNADGSDATINPVIYVATAEGMNLDDDEYHVTANSDGTGGLTAGVWKKYVAGETDLSQVHAIAIDMTEDTAGNKFILQKGASLTATLYMKAPKTIPETSTKKYPTAYNNVYMQTWLSDSDGNFKKNDDGTPNVDYIHQNWTEVRYTVTADFDLHKISAKNANESISGITFTLKGTSDYGTEVNETKTTDKNGMISFKDIEKGSYTLQEASGTVDWLEDHSEHTVTVNGDGTVSFDAGSDLAYVTYSAVFTKIDGYLSYRLTGTSVNGNTVDMTCDLDDKTNKVTFDNLEVGSYTLTARKTAETSWESATSGDVISRMLQMGTNGITADGKLTVSGDNTTYTAEDITVTVKNNPRVHTDIRFKKVDQLYTSTKLEGAEFTLKGTSDYGTDVFVVATSMSANEGELGLVIFTNIEKGAYELTETKAPANHVLNNTVYKVVIDEYGSYAITVKE